MYLHGPMDYPKMVKLRIRVGDPDLPETRTRYTGSREEKDLAPNICPCDPTIEHRTDSCNDRGAPPFSVVPLFGNIRPLSKTILIKLELLPDEKPHAQAHNEHHAKTKPISDNFELRSNFLTSLGELAYFRQFGL